MLTYIIGGPDEAVVGQEIKQGVELFFPPKLTSQTLMGIPPIELRLPVVPDPIQQPPGAGNTMVAFHRVVHSTGMTLKVPNKSSGSGHAFAVNCFRSYFATGPAQEMDDQCKTPAIAAKFRPGAQQMRWK